MKLCTKCQIEKGESEFYRHKRKNSDTYYLRAACRTCDLAQSQANRKAKWNSYYKAKVTAHNAKREVSAVQLRAWISSLKKNEPCIDCGNVFAPESMDFDHTNPAIKSWSASRMASDCKSKEAILDELIKCDLVCSNCHRTRTNLQREEKAFRCGPKDYYGKDL